MQIDEEAKALLTAAALDIQLRFPELFEPFPVRIVPIAESLGIKVIRTSTMSGRAQLKIVDPATSTQQTTIYVSRAFGSDYARFAVAHEIGHYYLHTYAPEINRRISAPERELFCHRFAGEILIPQHRVAKLKDQLFAIKDAEGWVRLAGTVGISVAALFQICHFHRDDWLNGCPIVILLVRRSSHPRPAKNNLERSGPKLRVRVALFDGHRFYFPTLQGISSLLKPTDWLLGLQDGRASTNLVEIRYSSRTAAKKGREQGEAPKFELKQELVPVSAMRLLPVEGERNSNFVLVLSLGQ